MKNYSISDHLVAITIVALIILVISIPFLFFYLTMYGISLTPNVSLNASGFLSCLKVIIKFFMTAIIVTVIIKQIIKIESGKNMVDYLSETILMFLVFYLFVMVYTHYSNDLVITKNGILYRRMSWPSLQKSYTTIIRKNKIYWDGLYEKAHGPQTEKLMLSLKTREPSEAAEKVVA